MVKSRKISFIISFDRWSKIITIRTTTVEVIKIITTEITDMEINLKVVAKTVPFIDCPLNTINF